MTRRLFGTLCGLVFLVNFGRTAFAPLVQPLRTEFGVSTAVIGTVTTLVWVGSAAPRVPVGYLLTRVPRRRVVVGAGALLAAASLFAATATTVPALQLGAFAVGLASGAYFVAAVPLVGELFPDSMGRAVGVHGMSSQVAAVLAPGAVVGVLAVGSWRTVFHLLAAFAVALTVALAVVLRRRDVTPTAGADRDFAGALSHWRVIATGVFVVASAGFAWQGLFNFYVPYLVEGKGLSTATANTLLTVVFAAGVPAFWLSGRLADRLPHLPYLLAIHLSFLCCLLALTAISSVAALFVVTAALGYVIHSIFPAADAYMLETLPAASRASAYALFSGVALLIEATGSGVVGALTAASYGYDQVFRLFGLLLIGAFLALAGLYLAGRLPGAPAAPFRRGARARDR